MHEDELLKRLFVDPGIFNGRPIVRGMRFAVEHVLGMLAAGETIERIAAEYSFLERADVQACIAYAYRAVAGEQIRMRISMPGEHA